MTRREYPIPANLSGDRLAEELTAAGVQTGPFVVSVTGDRLVLVWDRDLSPEEITLADRVVAAHDWTEAKERQARRAKVKELAQALASSLDDPMAVISRAGLRAAYGAILETRQAVRALVAWANAQGASIPQLTPDRTWKQVLNAGKALAQSETNPEA